MMKSIEKMTAAECTKALEELRARRAEIKARVDEIREPNKAQPAPPDAGPTGWKPPDPLTGAGPEYRRVIEAGDTRALVKLKDERKELDAEAELIFHRSEQIKRRLPVAQEEEAKKAAPGVAKKSKDRLPKLLDELDAALLHVATLLDERTEVLRDYDQARERGAEVYFEPPLLRRTWASLTVPITGDLLRRHLSTRTDPINVMVRDAAGGTMVDPGYRNECRDRLAPPDPGLLQRLRGVLPIEDPETLREIAAQRARLLGAGRFDELDDAREIAVEAVATRHRHPVRKREAVERVKRSFMTPSRETVAEKLSS